MTLKHTPGPWRIERASGITGKPRDTLVLCIDGADGKALAYIDSSYHKMTQEDARLIEASPRMLAILRELAGVINMSDSQHPDFADSGADVIAALWENVADDTRILLFELDGETNHDHKR